MSLEKDSKIEFEYTIDVVILENRAEGLRTIKVSTGKIYMEYFVLKIVSGSGVRISIGKDPQPFNTRSF